MSELELPEQLKGDWHHALILTYGVDVPFWENALLRQFGARCRNKVILADGRRYLESCAAYARNGLVRHLNQQYIVEGILAPHAAHGKMILLLHPERGRLLVGSGNLGQQGYASGGELFTAYEYSGQAEATLNAFLAACTLVDGLIEHGYVSGPAVQRIREMWEKTPWLYRTAIGDWQPVRHNLDASFLNQLQALIGQEPVEEVCILSPFYDRKAAALAKLESVFRPKQITLLIQPEWASVDPDALRQVLSHFSAECRICAVQKQAENPYLHAKLYLFKLRDRAICVQGSPNLSQVAMMLTVPHGNVEMANILDGPQDAFDHLLERLNIQPAAIDDLNLSYQSVEQPVQEGEPGWQLIGGQWRDDRLTLRFQGLLPDLQSVFLRIASKVFPLQICERQGQELVVQLSAEATSLLQHPVPVELCWDEQVQNVSNPVFVCNMAALDAVLLVVDDGDTLGRLGDLDLDDDEFEQLLAELDSALVFDRRSVWQLAGRNVSSDPDQDDEALRLDYADVDYEMLRRHPKIQQYLKQGGGSAYARSRLQIILSAITDHFNGLLEHPFDFGHTIVKELDELDPDQDGNEQDRDENEAQQQRRHQSQVQRIRRILKGFIQRYLRGIRSADFQAVAGFEVMAQNCVIFSYLLWRLFAKDWVESKFVVESFLKIWAFFWGDGTRDGYFAGLPAQDRDLALEWVREHRTDALLIASLYHSAYLAQSEYWVDLALDLRDFWRALLSNSQFQIDEQVFEESWHLLGHLYPYHPPTPTAIAEELRRLSVFDTPQHFCRAVEARYGYPPGSCVFEKCRVRRPALGRDDTVLCLTIDSKDALSDQNSAIDILNSWMQFQQLEYYRLQQPDTKRVLFYDLVDHRGVYCDPGNCDVDFESIEPSHQNWDAMLLRIDKLARELENRVRIALSVAEESKHVAQ